MREDIDSLRDNLNELEAKITSVDERYYTIAGYCSLYTIPCPLHQAKKWGKAAVKLSNDRDLPTGAAHDERYGQVRTYHEDVLKDVIKN